MSRNFNETGGPAFPTENERQIDHNAYHFEGITLRDYFAANVEGLDEAATPVYAEALIGRPKPNKTTSDPEVMLEWAIFWADANAAYRYLQADAMLRAREMPNDTN